MTRQTKSQLNAWTDEECELLLNIAIEYKNQHGRRTVELEPPQGEHDNMQYMDKVNKNQLNEKYMSNGGNLHTKEDIFSKMQLANRNYHQIMESGAKSGHRTANPFYFGLYSQLWASHVPDDMRAGHGMHDLVENNYHAEAMHHGMNRYGGRCKPGSLDFDAVDKGTGKYRKKFFESQYQKFKDAKLKEKLKRKISRNQNRSSAEGGASLKQQLIQQMKESDQRHQYNMHSMINQIQRQSQLINEGFVLMRSMLLPEVPDFDPEPPNEQNSSDFPSHGQHMPYTRHNFVYPDSGSTYTEQNLHNNYTHYFH